MVTPSVGVVNISLSLACLFHILILVTHTEWFTDLQLFLPLFVSLRERLTTISLPLPSSAWGSSFRQHPFLIQLSILLAVLLSSKRTKCTT